MQIVDEYGHDYVAIKSDMQWRAAIAVTRYVAIFAMIYYRN